MDMIRGEEALADYPGLSLSGRVELHRLDPGAPAESRDLTVRLRSAARDGLVDMVVVFRTVTAFDAGDSLTLPVMIDDFTIENIRSMGWIDVTWKVSASRGAALHWYCREIEIVELESVA